MTVRDNITFGEPFDGEKYKIAVQVCALDEDLKSLSNSRSFSWGGKSYGTSGGQGAGRGTSLLRTNNNAMMAHHLQASVSPSLEGAWPANSGFGTSAMLQGAWLAGSGHGTIADMLKGGPRESSLLSTSSNVPTAAPISTSLEQLSMSNMHLSALDPAASLSHTRSPGSAVKQETRFSDDGPSYGLQDGDSAHYVHANSSNALSAERDIDSLQPTDLNLSAPLEEQAQSVSGFLGGQSRSVSVGDVQEGQTGCLGSQLSGAPGYQHQQFVERHKDNDWGSHLITDEDDPPVEVISESTALDGPPLPAANLQDTSVRDNHSVIIPDHRRVSEADCTMLSFGSFDVGFVFKPKFYTIRYNAKRRHWRRTKLGL